MMHGAMNVKMEQNVTANGTSVLLNMATESLKIHSEC
jgi:hypothetical protein